MGSSVPTAVAIVALGAWLACSERAGDEPDAASPSTNGRSGLPQEAGGAPEAGGVPETGGIQGAGGNQEAGACGAAQSFSRVGLTQYDQAGVGNCDLPWPADNMYVAASSSEYDMGPLGPSGACGRCIALTGPAGQAATLAVVDQCPTATNPKCVDGHLDLSPQAYAAVVPSDYPTGGEVVNGASPTRWTYVACSVSGPIVYHFKDGTNPYWIAVQVRSARFGIKTIRYRAADGSWQDADARTDALAYFVISGLGSSTISLQAVDEFDRVLEDDGISFAANADVPGHAQFAPCPAGP